MTSDSSKYDKDFIDVLVPISYEYKPDNSIDGTSSYTCGGINLYSIESIDKVVVDDNSGEDVWRQFEKHLHKSEPLKFVQWESMMQKSVDSTAGSYLNRRGNLIESFDSLIESLPSEALDSTVTVQAKPPSTRCKLCSDEGDESPTEEEKMRHNLHIADSTLTVAQYNVGDEGNMFFGQGDQITTNRTLREILMSDTTTNVALKICVAQVNIYSRENSGVAASVTMSGRIIVEEAKNNKMEGQTNISELSSLLPWIRVPSFLLLNDQVVIQEVNLWLNPDRDKEIKTNTHYDGHHNILMVLHGTKTVELSPPGAIKGSPLHGQHTNHPFILQVEEVGGDLIHDNFKHDVSPYRLHNKAEENNIVVSVKKGQLLLIPEGWWHRVESSAECMAINIWFDHSSSLSSIVHDNNQHQLPYQAREMVRRYIEASIEHANKERFPFAIMLDRLGMTFGGYRREPGKPIRHFINEMHLGRIIPQERKNEEIVKGLAVIERYGIQVLGVSFGENSGDIQPLRLLALPHATTCLGTMISLFITVLDSSKPRDRVAMFSLFQRFPPVTSHFHRQVFTSIIEGITQEACYTLSIAWEKHESVSDVEASYTSLFGRCVGDKGRKHFTKQVDNFRNETAKKLILEDLMLLNPA